MITCVSLSPAIDRRLVFDSFAVGATNRVLETSFEGAGKAVDVALAARALDMPVRCTGLLQEGGEAITGRLSGLGVPTAFLQAPGRGRVNQKLYARDTGITTEIGEPVPAAPEDILHAAADQAARAARESDFLVLTGSLPTGCPADWYARVIRRVRDAAPACRCVLDAEGERFTLGIKAGPWLVKPNLYELSLAAGRPLTSHADIQSAARALVSRGASNVVVSMGGDGAMAVSGDEAWLAPAIPADIQTTTGAGDAMVAGALHGFAREGSLAAALRHGIAAATARCAYGGERYLDRALFDAYLPQVTLFSL